MEWDLSLIWAGIICAVVALYVILDGFDLGVGILFPFARSEAERDQMLAAVAPFWDGNETWLVFGGTGLWVAFPRAYGVIMSALYLPVIVMILSLVFRGAAFEFRTVASSRIIWNIAFTTGSAVAAICQGVMLGGLIQGIRVAGNTYAGGAFDWATPFALLCGIGVFAVYALLGATWLAMKTEQTVAERARRQAKVLLVAVLAFMAAASLWIPIAFERVSTRWFSTPNIYYLWLVPALTAFVALLAWRWLDQKRETLPFLAAIALFLLGYLGIVVSVFPYLVPPDLTIWDSAAPPTSQGFMLLGTLSMIPIVLAYVVFVYWVFRGKIRGSEHYH